MNKLNPSFRRKPEPISPPGTGLEDSSSYTMGSGFRRNDDLFGRPDYNKG
jgi:hypothetical protein